MDGKGKSFQPSKIICDQVMRSMLEKHKSLFEAFFSFLLWKGCGEKAIFVSKKKKILQKYNFSGKDGFWDKLKYVKKIMQN